MASAEEVQMTVLGVAPHINGKENPLEAKMDDSINAEEGKSRRVKKPRRILHFSDGTLEEYSTEEEEEEVEKSTSKECGMVLSDPKSLTWGAWMYYWMLYSGSSALSACDYVGESLANFLGITSPKYHYEIEEFKRSLEEEKKEKEAEDAEMAGWRSKDSPVTDDNEQVVSSTIEHAPSPSHSLKQDATLSSQESDGPKDSTVQVSSEKEIANPTLPEDSKTISQDSADWKRF